MGNKIVIMVVSVLFVMGVFLPMHTVAFAGCKEDCYKDCCGDESICTSEDERSCVSDCLKEFCDNSNSSAQIPARTDKDSGGGDSGIGGNNDSNGNNATAVSDGAPVLGQH